MLYEIKNVSDEKKIMNPLLEPMPFHKTKESGNEYFKTTGTD